MSFWRSIPGRRRGSTLFVIAGEEVGSDEISSAFFRRAEPSGRTTPAGGGGPAGAVLVVNPREEVKADRIRQGRGGGRPWRNSLDRALAGDGLDLVADDAKVMKLAVRKATQLEHRVAISALVTIVAHEVHFRILSNSVGSVRTRGNSGGLAGHVGDVTPANSKVAQFAVAQAIQLGDGFAVTAPVAVVADQVHRLYPFSSCFGSSVSSVRGEDRSTFIDLKALLAHGSNANCATQHGRPVVISSQWSQNRKEA